ncbi:MAG TPA: ankyrin repeat domain-containing protein, partial [Nannocystis sp.]
ANRVAALLDAGAEIDAKNTGAGGIPTPLIAAAFCGHTEVVRLLLARGADVDAVNSQGRNALVQAADQGHAEIVELLAHAGSAVDQPGLFGQTALHLAAWQGHRAVVETLLACAARTDLRDDAGMTPLALACTEDVPEVVELLLAAGAPVEERSGSTDATPLIMAAIDGQARVAGVLLHHGACRDARDRNGRTAAEWARAEGHESVAQLLEA